MFAGIEEKYGGRKKKACLRKAWSRGDQAVEEQRPECAKAKSTRFQCWVVCQRSHGHTAYILETSLRERITCERITCESWVTAAGEIPDGTSQKVALNSPFPKLPNDPHQLAFRTFDHTVIYIKAMTLP